MTSTKFASFNWLRGVADDTRITIVHRLILIRLCLHRHNASGRCEPGYDVVADELEVDRATLYRAVEKAVGFGWLAGSKHGGGVPRNFVFTFPAEQSHPCDGSTVAAVQPLQTPTVAEKRSNSRRKGPQQSQANVQATEAANEFAPEREKEREKRTGEEYICPPPDFAPRQSRPNDDAPRKKKPGAKNKHGATVSSAGDDAESFQKFWQAYPRRVAKEAARKAFERAVKGGVDPEVLIAGAQRYAVERQGQDAKFTKHPATWLNKGCWEDELTGAPVIDETGNLVAVEPQPPQPRDSRDKTPLEVGAELLAELEERDRRDCEASHA